jgi:hypothetical protein
VSAIRYTRQARLVEVGENGQARLAKGDVSVRGAGLSASIEARYLAGAGVGLLRVKGEAQAIAARAIDASVRVVIEAGDAADEGAKDRGSPLNDLPLDPDAREVALGAWRALDALRGLLGVKGAGA